jgi:hypothetical protein
VDGFDDDDVVLSVIALAIGSLVPYVGGIHYAHTLLPPLEALLAVGTFCEPNNFEWNPTAFQYFLSII